MKILSASVCAAVLALAVPAMAATEGSMSMHHHHAGKHAMMKGKKGMKSDKAVDASTDELNEKSLAAARGGAPAGDTGAATPATSTPAPMAPASGTPASTAPANAPGG